MKLDKEKIKKGIIKFLKEPLLYLIIIVAILQGVIYTNTAEIGRTGDTEGYLHSYDNGSIFKGFISDVRPPVYPYFIKTIKKIGGEENLERNVAIAQKILFFITLILFYCTLKLLIKNRIILCILTLIFGIAPSVVIWNSFIITEALTGLEIMVLAFITIKYLKKPSKLLGALTGLVIITMILTKPAFIYIIPIYLLFVILRWFLNKDERKKLFFAIGSVLLCCVILIMYCMKIKTGYGVFGVTSVSNINTMLTIIYSGAYNEKPDEPVSMTIKEATQGQPTEAETYEIYFNNVAPKYSLSELQEYSKKMVNTKTYIEFIINRFVSVGNANIGVTYDNGNNSANGSMYNFRSLNGLVLPITFGFVYIILLASIIYLIWYLIKYKKIDWICAFFTSMIFANIFTLIVGAPFEEQRLFFPSVCLVLLYLGVIVDKIKLKEEILLNEKNV